LLLAEQSFLVHQRGLFLRRCEPARFGEALLGVREPPRAHAHIRERLPDARLLRRLDPERFGDVERSAVELRRLDVRELLLRSRSGGE